jgi:signal transduction histidine kinase
MLVYLVSGSAQTHTLCCEVLGELAGETCTVQCVTPPLHILDADLFLWDIFPDPGILAAIPAEETWRHFFFIDRANVEQLQQMLPLAQTHILLKPVTRAALQAFLTNACEQARTARVSIEALRDDRDALLDCLLQTNLKLQAYDHDRTNFLARAIHDFRAPLTAVTGYCALLLGEDVGTLTAEQRDVIGRMHQSAKKLSRMASSMFQLSIAPRQDTALDPQPHEIRECIDQAVHEILPAAQEKRLSITTDARPAPEPFCFDRMKIEQVLVNLLDNACKFTPRGGRIEVKGYPCFWEDGADSVSRHTLGSNGRKNAYRLDIRDTGPGIPPAHLSTIFEEYTSYCGGADRSGGGLGLAVCRMILSQHSGKIWAESCPGGAVFSFVLPFQHSIAGDRPSVRRMNAHA